jgi:putative addiction module component (TIGR02574 family)
MDQELKSVIDKALNMSHENRALIVDRLIDSLDVNTDHDVEAAWQQLIQKRIDEAERGEAEFISWDDAKEKLQIR